MTLHRAVNLNLGSPDQSAENSLAKILIVSLNFTSAGMDLSLVLVLAIVADLLILKIIPARRRVARFVCMSVFFALQTVLIVALIGSPLRPVFKPKDLPHEFWLQILTCLWWALAARELIAVLALPAALRKTTIENKILSDIIAACIYVCSALAMLGFVFALPLQGIVATSIDFPSLSL